MLPVQLKAEGGAPSARRFHPGQFCEREWGLYPDRNAAVGRQQNRVAEERAKSRIEVHAMRAVIKQNEGYAVSGPGGIGPNVTEGR